MKMFLRKQKAFTLIEIIVVLIILGGLAALAFQNYFSWIAKSNSAEAIVMMKSIRDNMIPCLVAHQGSEPSCYPSVGVLTTCSAGMCGPAGGSAIQFSSSHFNYQIRSWYHYSTVGYDPSNLQDFTIYAISTSNSLDGINFAYRGSDNKTTCWTTGVYTGIC